MIYDYHIIFPKYTNIIPAQFFRYYMKSDAIYIIISDITDLTFTLENFLPQFYPAHSFITLKNWIPVLKFNNVHFS